MTKDEIRARLHKAVESCPTAAVLNLAEGVAAILAEQQAQIEALHAASLIDCYGCQVFNFVLDRVGLGGLRRCDAYKAAEVKRPCGCGPICYCEDDE